MRTIALAASIFTTALVVSTATPAHAQSTTAYRATLATATTGASTAIAGGMLWRCNGADCASSSSASRPSIVCETAVKRVGRFESFSVSGTAFDAAALAKCNAKAKGGPTAIAVK